MGAVQRQEVGFAVKPHKDMTIVYVKARLKDRLEDLVMYDVDYEERIINTVVACRADAQMPDDMRAVQRTLYPFEFDVFTRFISDLVHSVMQIVFYLDIDKSIGVAGDPNWMHAESEMFKVAERAYQNRDQPLNDFIEGHHAVQQGEVVHRRKV